MATKIDKIAKVHITRSDTNTGIDSPVGAITPKFIGQEYICGNGSKKKIFKSNGLTNNDWLELGEVPEIDLSGYATNVKVDEVNTKVEANKTSISELRTLVDNARLNLINTGNEIINNVIRKPIFSFDGSISFAISNGGGSLSLLLGIINDEDRYYPQTPEEINQNSYRYKGLIKAPRDNYKVLVKFDVAHFKTDGQEDYAWCFVKKNPYFKLDEPYGVDLVSPILNSGKYSYEVILNKGDELDIYTDERNTTSGLVKNVKIYEVGE